MGTADYVWQQLITTYDNWYNWWHMTTSETLDDSWDNWWQLMIATNQVTGQGESGKMQAEQLLIMTSVLVPFLARLVMVNMINMIIMINLIIMMRRMKMIVVRRAWIIWCIRCFCISNVTLSDKNLTSPHPDINVTLIISDLYTIAKNAKQLKCNKKLPVMCI